MKNDEKLTIIYINDFSILVKYEITVKEYFSYENEEGFLFRLRGKRTNYVYEPNNNYLIFKGWDIPLKIERELSSSSSLMNGTIRIGGVDDALEWVKKNNVNEQFNRFDRIVDLAKNPRQKKYSWQ